MLSKDDLPLLRAIVMILKECVPAHPADDIVFNLMEIDNELLKIERRQDEKDQG